MKSITEIRDWLLENAVDDDGDLNMPYLDFSDFDGDVYIRGMKVQGNLYQEYQEVKGNLFQEYQEVKGNLFQGSNEVKGDLYQGSHKIQGDLYQSCHKIQGDYICKNVQVKGNIFANEPTKLLKEITTEELAKMGYKLKGGNK